MDWIVVSELAKGLAFLQEPAGRRDTAQNGFTYNPRLMQRADKSSG